MTSPQADAYAAEQQAAVMAAVAVAATAAGMAGFQLANFTVFLRFLRLLFPVVVRSRERAAWSARNFFDRERLRVTGLPQLDVPLIPDYRFDWFVNDMKPAYKMAVKQIAVARELEKTGRPAPAPRLESTVRVAVAKVVADAGREQMISAVEADVENIKNLRESRREARQAIRDLDAKVQKVRGWARVATGNETCPWCLMLVSRGPVYLTAESAGANPVDDILDDAGLTIPMNEWHTGCDCTVVPVFDKDNWSGKQAADEALEMWKAASEDFKYDPDKKYRFGHKGKDDKWTFSSSKATEGLAKYRETLNNLRFTLEGRDPKDRQRVSKEMMDEIVAMAPGAAKLFRKELSRR